MHDPRWIALFHQMIFEQLDKVGAVVHQQNAMAGA
jgi:hypothetical protein